MTQSHINQVRVQKKKKKNLVILKRLAWELERFISVSIITWMWFYQYQQENKIQF